eukprot:s1_g1845.t1
MAVRTEKNGPVTTIIIDRVDVRNAVDRTTAAALAEAFLAFEKDDEASVGVFVGANGTFCAGADLKAVSKGGGSGNSVSPVGTGLQFDRLAADGPMGPSRMILSKPVIGAISGYAVAGGLELALWCDMRVVEEDAVMGVFCRRWGVPLVDGGTVRLPRLIGHSRAMDLILTGRPVDAQEALSFGLANRVVPTGEGRAAAEALAVDMARFPQNCLRSDRLSAYEQWDLPYDQAMAGETIRGRSVFRDLSFQVAPGEMLTLVGPNGSGKSSLLRQLGGLLEIAGGDIVLDGLGDDQTIADVALYAGHLDAVKAPLSVFENLSFWAEFYGVAADRVDAALETFSLDHLSHLPAGVLSAGQKRRLGLSRLALIERPLWLLDEPTVSLDKVSIAALAALMQTHLEQGGSIVAATHVDLGIDGARTLDMGEVA